MKIIRVLLYGILGLSLLPALTQQSAAQTGKIHGRVINYTGQPQGAGIVCLSTDGGVTVSYSFPVDSEGNYRGEAPPGTYTLVYRMADTPPSLWIDALNNITIAAGKDLAQNDDMSRKEFIAELPDEQKKELEALKKQGAAAQNQDKILKAINADLAVALQDLKDAENARSKAQQETGKTAGAAEIDAKAAAIKSAKCAEAEALTLKNIESLKESGLTVDETALWENLGRAQIGLKKYDEAEKSLNRVLAIQAEGKNPNHAVEAVANAGLGEIYALTGKAAEATKAFDAAVQLDAAHGGVYLRNEALTFMQAGEAEAQIAAAEKAIKADPRDALGYYIKGNGLLKKAGADLSAKSLVLPPGCAEAYQKYLTLAPGGPYAAEIRAVIHRTEKRTSAAK